MFRFFCNRKPVGQFLSLAGLVYIFLNYIWLYSILLPSLSSEGHVSMSTSASSMLKQSTSSCVSTSTFLVRGCGHLWRPQLKPIVWPDLNHGILVSFSHSAAELSDSDLWSYRGVCCCGGTQSYTKGSFAWVLPHLYSPPPTSKKKGN